MAVFQVLTALPMDFALRVRVKSVSWCSRTSLRRTFFCRERHHHPPALFSGFSDFPLYPNLILLPYCLHAPRDDDLCGLRCGWSAVPTSCVPSPLPGFLHHAAAQPRRCLSPNTFGCISEGRIPTLRISMVRVADKLLPHFRPSSVLPFPLPPFILRCYYHPTL